MMAIQIDVGPRSMSLGTPSRRENPMQDPGSNQMLAVIPLPERDRIRACAEEVTLLEGQVLGEAGMPMRHAYFPIEGCTVLITAGDRMASLGVGLIGNESMCGSSLLLGTTDSPLRMQVQGPGNALRISAEMFQSVLVQTPRLERKLRLLCHLLQVQCAQTASCAAFH
ncbi:MAG: cyclic nucleotide-binding domain-containing protein, partial [Pseudomonadota bacterium]|nr:cyclic nucleotide-binding domain-containing protein [Pseudomonadota bacterium]